MRHYHKTRTVMRSYKISKFLDHHLTIGLYYIEEWQHSITIKMRMMIIGRGVVLSRWIQYLFIEYVLWRPITVSGTQYILHKYLLNRWINVKQCYTCYIHYFIFWQPCEIDIIIHMNEDSEVKLLLQGHKAKKWNPRIWSRIVLKLHVLLTTAVFLGES